MAKTTNSAAAAADLGERNIDRSRFKEVFLQGSGNNKEVKQVGDVTF